MFILWRQTRGVFHQKKNKINFKIKMKIKIYFLNGKIHPSALLKVISISSR